MKSLRKLNMGLVMKMKIVMKIKLVMDSCDLTKWRNQKYFSTWQSRAWETGKPGMSCINENSFSRWIIEKSDGITKPGIKKLFELVRDYAYLILTSQTSTRSQIIGFGASEFNAQ